MKTCFHCKEEKPITDFYKNSRGKGCSSKCKVCTCLEVKLRKQILISTPEGLEKERERQREKYHRLNYKKKHKPTPENKKKIISRYNEKYPEKLKAKNLSLSVKVKVKSNELHHWNYNLEYAKDVIELNPKQHSTAHRFITYYKETFMYKSCEGILLDTKEKHIEFLLQKGIQI